MPRSQGELPLTREERFRLLRGARVEGITRRKWDGVARLLEQLELCSGSGRCCPRIEVLAGRMRCCYDTARVRIRLAEELGLVTTTSRNGGCGGGQTSSEYRVHWERLRGVVRPPAEIPRPPAEIPRPVAENPRARVAENPRARVAENPRPIGPNNNLISTGQASTDRGAVEAARGSEEEQQAAALAEFDTWSEADRLAFVRAHVPVGLKTYRQRPRSPALRKYIAIALRDPRVLSQRGGR